MPKRKGRTPAKAAQTKRVDWSAKPAPKKGSRARAAYEKSAVYRARQRAADKARETRARHERAEQRRLAREERVAVAKERLGPLLAQVVDRFRRRRYFNDTRKVHANWYAAKVGFGHVMRRQDFERVLEELSLEHDLDELGWDIVY